MVIPDDKTPAVTRIINELYSSPFSEELILDVAAGICSLLESHYFAVFILPGKVSRIPLYISNNPPEFVDLYMQIASQDYLMDDLINTGSIIVLRRYKNYADLELREFSHEVQRMRPISDVCYLPVWLDGFFRGYVAVARKGLNNSAYSDNDLKLFQFLVSHLNHCLDSGQTIPRGDQATAVLNGYGEVLSTDNDLRKEFRTLFGDQYCDAPFRGLSHNSAKFQDALSRFLSPPFSPEEGGVVLHHGEGYRKLYFRYLKNRNLSSSFPGKPQVEVMLSRENLRHADEMNADPGFPDRRFQFTTRESDILQGVLKGWTNRQIGSHLGIEESTVKRHLWNMFNKVGVDSRTQLVLAVH